MKIKLVLVRKSFFFSYSFSAAPLALHFQALNHSKWRRIEKDLPKWSVMGHSTLPAVHLKIQRTTQTLSITCPDMTLKKQQQGFLVCNWAPVAVVSQLQPITHPSNNNYLIHKPLVSTIWHVLQQMKKHCLWLHWFYKTYISPLWLWVCTLKNKRETQFTTECD